MSAARSECRSPCPAWAPASGSAVSGCATPPASPQVPRTRPAIDRAVPRRGLDLGVGGPLLGQRDRPARPGRMCSTAHLREHHVGVVERRRSAAGAARPAGQRRPAATGAGRTADGPAAPGPTTRDRRFHGRVIDSFPRTASDTVRSRGVGPPCPAGPRTRCRQIARPEGRHVRRLPAGQRGVRLPAAVGRAAVGHRAADRVRRARGPRATGRRRVVGGLVRRVGGRRVGRRRVGRRRVAATATDLQVHTGVERHRGVRDVPPGQQRLPAGEAAHADRVRSWWRPVARRRR